MSQSTSRSIVCTFLFAIGFGSVGNATWMHRAILGGKPDKIRLVVLFLYLNPSEFAARDELGRTLDQVAREQDLSDLADWLADRRIEQPHSSSQTETATCVVEVNRESGCPAIYGDVIRILLRHWHDMSLMDAARVANVSRYFRTICMEPYNTYPPALAGRVNYVVKDTSDLIRLIALDGSPLLRTIGRLTFAFGESAIVPWEFELETDEVPPGYPPEVDEGLFFENLFRDVLLDFSHFVQRNLNGFCHIHAVEIQNGSSECEMLIVRPLLLRVLSPTHFPSLRSLQVARTPLGEFANIPFHLHFLGAVRSKPLEVLALNLLLVSTVSEMNVIVDCIQEGWLRSLRKLDLRNAQINDEQMGRLTTLIETGHLVCLQEFHLDPLITDQHASFRLLQALGGSQISLRRLCLSAWDSIAAIFVVAREGGFVALQELDASCACNYGDVQNDAAVRNLRDIFPSLRAFCVSCSQLNHPWIQTAFDSPLNSALLRLPNFEELCANFIRNEIFSAGFGFENPRLDSLRRICNFPRQPTSSNPELTRIVERSRGLIRFGIGYAYTDRDMHWLLWLSLGQQVDLADPHRPLISGHTVLFPPLGLRYSTAVGQIGSLLTNYFVGVHGDQTRLVIPINVRHHWMTLIIDLEERNGALVHAYLLDTFEAVDHEFVQDVREGIETAFTQLGLRRTVTIDALAPRVVPSPQCGPATVENIVDAVGVTGEPRMHHLTANGVRVLRGHHYRLLRDNGERLEEEFRAAEERSFVNAVPLPNLAVALMTALLATAQRSINFRK